MKIKIPEYIKDGIYKYKYILLVCIIGIILMLLPANKFNKSQNKNTVLAPEIDIAKLEKTAEKLFSKIEGVGEVEVKITLKSGYETVYAADIEQNSTEINGSLSAQYRKELVTVNSSGSQKPIAVKIRYPEYLGAVIVCEGGDKSKIKLELTQAMRSLTGISADNIVVAKMK